ncbi:hypothetical protein R1flu_014018 [Riccia fluitans]|uniref:Uncharacterized protein n=1 Tax=Riccia fluitans TaxID=41844 RepID=A0ABD1YIM6_9MARC
MEFESPSSLARDRVGGWLRSNSRTEGQKSGSTSPTLTEDYPETYHPKSGLTGLTLSGGSLETYRPTRGYTSPKLTDDDLKTYRPMRVKSIFDMKTLQEVRTHDHLWQIMEKLPGWTSNERAGCVDYILESSRRKCLAQATLPADLDSASPQALENFVHVVNKFQHADIFALWDTFKLCQPAPKPSRRGSVNAEEEKRSNFQSFSTSERLHGRPRRLFC